MDQKPQNQTPATATPDEELQKALEIPAAINAEVSEELKSQMQETEGPLLAQPEKPQPLPNAPQSQGRVLQQTVNQPAKPTKTGTANSSIALIVVAVLIAILLIIFAVGVYLS